MIGAECVAYVHLDMFAPAAGHGVMLLALFCSLCAESCCAALVLLLLLHASLLRLRLQVLLMCGNSCSACVMTRPTLSTERRVRCTAGCGRTAGS